MHTARTWACSWFAILVEYGTAFKNVEVVHVLWWHDGKSVQLAQSVSGVLVISQRR
jgi:hypothetical protein